MGMVTDFAAETFMFGASCCYGWIFLFLCTSRNFCLNKGYIMGFVVRNRERSYANISESIVLH